MGNAHKHIRMSHKLCVQPFTITFQVSLFRRREVINSSTRICTELVVCSYGFFIVAIAPYKSSGKIRINEIVGSDELSLVKSWVIRCSAVLVGKDKLAVVDLVLNNAALQP